MATDPQIYLAEQVLNEGRIVTYRSLSRALKTNVTRAKELLFDFHKTQNARRTGSVHATYLVSGFKTKPLSASSSMEINDRIISPQSSPFIPSSIPNGNAGQDAPVSHRYVTLVGEEKLEAEVAALAKAISVHVYSLEQSALKDIQLLEDASKGLTILSTAEELKLYGIIGNPLVQRRIGGRPTGAALPGVLNKPSAAFDGSKPELEPAKSVAKAAISASNPNPPASVKGFVKTTKTAAGFFKPASRSGSTLSKTAGNDASPALSRADSGVESKDEVMKDMSGDEYDDDDDDLLVSATKNARKLTSAKKMTAAEKDAELRKLMEEDFQSENDVAMEDAPEPKPEEEVKPEPVEETKAVEETTSGGRRRSRRKIMKKLTVKDEEGYLVTKEEAVWESYSEDEPPPKKRIATGPSATGQKGTKQGGKGNIMSFFSKK